MAEIAIIGGGIGGLSAALALREFGFEPEVFEQAPALLDVGAAIAIWPNAMRILQRLGVAEKIMERAGVIKQVRWLHQDGKLINNVRISKQWADSTATNTTRPTEAPAVAVHRADLQHTLLHALPSSSIHLGSVFLNLQQGGKQIHAYFANREPIACELLIGADGLHSHMRSQVVDDGPPIYRGYYVWRGISPVVPNGLEPGTAVEIHGRGTRFGIGPVGLGKTGWWASANRVSTDNPIFSERFGDVKTRDAPENLHTSSSHNTRQELLNMFAGWCYPVCELIQATPSESILKTQAFDRPSSRSWGRHRMTLLGDAIHPTTPNLGQGGCMAIEDALILARCLQKYGASEHALRTYEQLRYERTAAVSGFSRLYGTVGQWENVWVTHLRTHVLSLTPEFLLHGLMRIIFDYDANSVRV
jgi:2-polyprenyl-6-methoxyphenol hydroxylase-like FAD-dependent oxidoreductase